METKHVYIVVTQKRIIAYGGSFAEYNGEHPFRVPIFSTKEKAEEYVKSLTKDFKTTWETYGELLTIVSNLDSVFSNQCMLGRNDIFSYYIIKEEIQ